MTSRPAAPDAPPQPAAQRRSLEATSALVPMLVLTFGTGVLDAATYLGLHGVFTANMTGNVIFIGLGLAGFETQVLLRAGLALAGFMAGAVVVGRAARGRTVHQHADVFSSWTLVVVSLVITAMAVLLSAGDLSARGLDAVTAVISAAMGAQAVAARRVGVPDVPTVVVTSAIVGLSADHRWSGRTHDRAVLLRRAGAVASMLVGAMVGALLLRMHIGAGVGTSALLLLVVGLHGLVAARRARAAG
ncbi:YoaK family protein [Quadrisphaera setariae]|nr:YoaK family protein [Quadrisphaera setariae]